MRLRMKFWPQGMISAISACSTGKSGGVMLRFFSWQGLGAAVLGVLLAKWAWVLLAPASPAIPAAVGETSNEAERVFGTASVTDVSAIASLGNIKLIGVFAHRTKGFAVMQVDEKQIGVGLGDEIKPGVRLVETNTDHVILEQAGIRRRLDLTGAVAMGVTGPAPSYVAPVPIPPAPTYTAPAPAKSHSGHTPPEQIDSLQRQLDAVDNIQPEQREILKRKLEMMRGQH